MELADFALARIVVSLADVVPNLETEMVGVQAALVRPHDLIVPHEELEVEVLGKLEAVEDLAVPVARPALVHDLGFDLGNEVLRLLVDDRQQILLPLREKRVVVPHEEQQILLGRGRNLLEIGLVVFLRGGEARETDRRVARAPSISRSTLGFDVELLDRQVPPALQ